MPNNVKKRLTRKDGASYFYEKPIMVIDGMVGVHYDSGEHIDKLGKLEDIEEEIGIDLVTFFKFLNAKVCYEKDPDDNEITKCLITGITKTGILNVQEAFPYGECEREAKFTDYGKTWALTREELENDN